MAVGGGRLRRLRQPSCLTTFPPLLKGRAFTRPGATSSAPCARAVCCSYIELFGMNSRLCNSREASPLDPAAAQWGSEVEAILPMFDRKGLFLLTHIFVYSLPSTQCPPGLHGHLGRLFREGRAKFEYMTVPGLTPHHFNGLLRKLLTSVELQTVLTSRK